MAEYANASYPTPQADRPMPEGDALSSRLYDRACDVANFAHRLEAFADRLVGGGPPKAIGNKESPVAPGMPPFASRLRNTEDAMSTGLKMLSEQMQRLESFV